MFDRINRTSFGIGVDNMTSPLPQILVMLLCGALPRIGMNTQIEKSAPAWEELAETCQRARALQTTIRDAEGPRRAQRARDALRELGSLVRPSKPGSVVVAYLHVKARLIAEEDRGAVIRDAIALCSSSPEVAPETIELVWTVAWDSGDTQSRCMIEESLGCVLPVSPYGGYRDGRAESLRLIGERPMIPRIAESQLFRIADLCSVASLPQLASKAYVEAIYDTAVPIGSGAWVSSKTGALWLKAARAAGAAGDHKLMATYAAKAIIFGDDSHAAEGQKLLQEVAAGKFTPTTTAPAAIDRDALLSIARLYVEMNLHPRALALLRQHQAVLGDEGQALATQCTTEWTKLVDRYCNPQMVQNCTLFGQEIARTDVANMRIPWPCEPAEVEKAVIKLRQAPLLGK